MAAVVPYKRFREALADRQSDPVAAGAPAAVTLWRLKYGKRVATARVTLKTNGLQLSIHLGRQVPWSRGFGLGQMQLLRLAVKAKRAEFLAAGWRDPSADP